ncbi:hypothetical protein V1525DRAFT_374784, partial [Lipomyces kononenkoae]
ENTDNILKVCSNTDNLKVCRQRQTVFSDRTPLGGVRSRLWARGRTKSRHSLQIAKRGAGDWLRSSSVTSRQCSRLWARGQPGIRGESKWLGASRLVHCRFQQFVLYWGQEESPDRLSLIRVRNSLWSTTGSGNAFSSEA